MNIDVEAGTPAYQQVSRPAAIRPLGLAIMAAAMSLPMLFTAVPGLQGQNTPVTVRADPAMGQITLREAVRFALDRNRQVRTAELQLQESEERVSEAWSSVYPRIEARANYTRNLKPAVNFLPAQIFNPDAAPDELIQVQFGADNTWSSSVDLTQTLFDPAIFIGVGAAGRFKGLQQEMVRGQKHAVVTRVRGIYYNVMLAQEQYRLTENSVRRVRQSLSDTKAMNRAGIAADYDVLRLEVQLANLEPNLRRADNSVRDARRQLAVELDMELDQAETLTVAGSLAQLDMVSFEYNSPENQELLRFAGVDLSSPTADVDELVRRAEENRSDLRQLELTESLRKTEMRLEQVEYLPKISMFASYGINAQENGSPDFFGETAFQRATSSLVGVTISVPLFTGFKRDARIDQKRAVFRAAETQSELVRDQAETQIRALAEQAEEARLRATAQTLAVSQADRGFQIASAQYREGISGQLELTDAEVALRESEFNYAQAVYDFLIARAQLDEAVGFVPFVDEAVEVEGDQ